MVVVVCVLLALKLGHLTSRESLHLQIVAIVIKLDINLRMSLDLALLSKIEIQSMYIFLYTNLHLKMGIIFCVLFMFILT